MNMVKMQDVKLIHRNPLHSYTLTMKKQKEIEEIIPFTISTKRIKCFGKNLPKEKNDLYTETCETFMREIKDHTHRLRNIPCSWTWRTKAIYRFNAIPIKLQWYFSQN